MLIEKNLKKDFLNSEVLKNISKKAENYCLTIEAIQLEVDKESKKTGYEQKNQQRFLYF